MLVSMLGTFLWATPAISAELERRSWVYLAVRPNGGTAVLLGKYLAAVSWVLAAAVVGLAIALAVSPTDDWRRIGVAIVRLVFLSCPAYAAVYLLLGTLFPKRSMAIAVAYTLMFELIISLVPAMINQFTVQYRLRALLVNWADVSIGDQRGFVAMALTGDAPAWHHVLILTVYTLFLLAVSVGVLRASEFSSEEESGV
jgi:ABC-type transport system involved in multi-copper enzyme maturation permease subunit